MTDEFSRDCGVGGENWAIFFDSLHFECFETKKKFQENIRGIVEHFWVHRDTSEMNSSVRSWFTIH